jgi:PilZ domain
METMFSMHSFKRRWQRSSAHAYLPVRLVVHRTGCVDCIDGRGWELNDGGMCVLAAIEMPLGTQVAVEFTSPSTHNSQRLWAAVRNRVGYRYGLEFLAENTIERTQVERYRHDLRPATQPN